MRNTFWLAFMVVLAIQPLTTIAQKTHNGQPLLISKSRFVDLGLDGDWYSMAWSISPEIPHDTLAIKLLSRQECVSFRTDRDSIGFVLKRNQFRSFYLQQVGFAPAHTVVYSTAFHWNRIRYDRNSKDENVKLHFEQPNHPYFDSLRKAYPLADLIKNEKTDKEKVLGILNWTHHQWKHDGGNAPKGDNGLSILREVAQGGRFPCFAYSIVLRDQLLANGYKARVLYLKTADAETRKSSPGHVVTEVYLTDQKKWAFIDGQFNVMPTLHGVPLNAVEFQKALSNRYESVEMTSRGKVSKRDYIQFVYDYLFYFDTTLDNRLLPLNQKFKIAGKSSIMLLPVNAPPLRKIGFWNSEINYCHYTTNYTDFYPNF
jgi:hypothetical protein